MIESQKSLFTKLPKNKGISDLDSQVCATMKLNEKPPLKKNYKICLTKKLKAPSRCLGLNSKIISLLTDLKT